MAARRGVVALISVLLVLVLLVVAFVVADHALRGYAENQIKAQLVAQLPPQVKADPSVSIGGVSFIAGYLSGSLESVALDAPRLTVDGIELAVHIYAEQVPTAESEPVTSLTGTISLNQAAVDQIMQKALATDTTQLGEDARLTLGDGTLSYDGSVSFLGIEVGYSANAEPVAKGTRIDLVPTAIKVTSGTVAIDVTALLGEVAADPVPICVAQYLPQDVLVTGVEVQPEQATITLEAENVVLRDLDFDAHGSCSE